MKKKLKVFTIINLGCFKNLVDSQAIMGNMIQHGFYYTDDLDRADIIIVNTCGFINPAKKESIQTIKEAVQRKLYGSCQKLIVVGCLVQREQNHLQRLIPEIDVLLGINEIPDILSKADLLNKHSKLDTSGTSKTIIFDKATWLYDGEIPRVLTGSPHYSFIKIAEGCNHTCSFCIIPVIKGNYRSRRIASIMEEARGLAKSQVKELILISQDTSFYGLDSGQADLLIQLLRQLVKIPEFLWIRLLYLYPEYVTSKLIDLIAREPKICKYFDIPFQHCSRKILASMKRAGSTQKCLELVHEIRRKIPAVSLRTSVIVGFPGESEKEFEELLEFCRKVKFENLGVFIYYDEKEAQSYSLSDKIPYKEKIRRKNVLLKEQKKILAQKRNSVINTIYESMIDEKNGSYYTLRYQGMAPEIDGIIYAHELQEDSHKKNNTKKKFDRGDIVKVKITKVRGYEWYGYILND